MYVHWAHFTYINKIDVWKLSVLLVFPNTVFMHLVTRTRYPDFGSHCKDEHWKSFSKCVYQEPENVSCVKMINTVINKWMWHRECKRRSKNNRTRGGGGGGGGSGGLFSRLVFLLSAALSLHHSAVPGSAQRSAVEAAVAGPSLCLCR